MACQSDCRSLDAISTIPPCCVRAPPTSPRGLGNSAGHNCWKSWGYDLGAWHRCSLTNQGEITMNAEAVVSTSEQQDQKEEFHDKPVPIRARLGFKEPALVWSGFGIAYICAVIGGLIQQGLGTTSAILAILLGNFILFLYSAAIGYASGKWGLNFPLT